MMIQTYALICCGALILLFLAFFFQKKALLLGLVSGLLFTVAGILLFSNALTVIIGSTTTTVGSTATTAVTTEEINSNLNQLIAWGSMIIGVATFIGFAITMNNKRLEDYSEDFEISPGSALNKEW